MALYGTEQLHVRMQALADQYEQLQAELQDLEDRIADGLVRLNLLESERRVDFLEMRDQYVKKMGVEQRKLALLQERVTENRLHYRRLEQQLASQQCQAAE